MECADIYDGVDARTKIGRTLGMGRHRVKVSRAKGYVFAVAGGRYVIYLPGIQFELRQYFIEAFLRQYLRVAPANTIGVPCQPFYFAVAYVEQNSLDRTGPQIDSCCKCHMLILIQCTMVRCAKVAAPNAPV